MKSNLVYLLLTLIVSSLHYSDSLAEMETKTEFVYDSIQFGSSRLIDEKLTHQQINYAFAGNPGKPGLLFIHGTPGGWSAFEHYLLDQNLQQEFFLISIDRLGWGGSKIAASSRNGGDAKEIKTLKANKIAADFSLQARSIASVMERYPDITWILVGHSLGASIAPKVALIKPNKVSGLLLLAGSLDPKLGKPRWYNRIANTKLIKWLMSKDLGHSNDEIMSLRQELEKLDTEIRANRLAPKLIVIQGMKDRLVSPKNALYVRENWQQHFTSVEVIELPDAGHFIPWQQSDTVKDAILKLIGSVSQPDM